MTAQIIAGASDIYHGGIRPFHVAWLSENDRPGWVLQNVGRDLYREEPGEDEGSSPHGEKPIVWIPSSPEHILEDGLLLIAMRAMRQEIVLAGAEKILDPEWADALAEGERVELGKVSDLGMDSLRDASKSYLDCKLVVTVLGGSSIEQQLPLLDHYRAEIEVCTVTYSRVSEGAFSAELAVRGSLTASWSSEGPTPHRYRAVNIPSFFPGALAEPGQTEDRLRDPDHQDGPRMDDSGRLIRDLALTDDEWEFLLALVDAHPPDVFEVEKQKQKPSRYPYMERHFDRHRYKTAWRSLDNKLRAMG